MHVWPRLSAARDLIDMKTVLLASSKLSRDQIAIAAALRANGWDAVVAAPKSKNEIYLMATPNIRIHAVGRRLIAGRKFRDFVARRAPIIHCLDQGAVRAARKFTGAVFLPIRHGIDLRIWNPDSVSTARQNAFLGEYGILPHQKLINVISPFGVGLDALVSAIPNIRGEDFVFGLFGAGGFFSNRDAMKKIAKSGFGHQIIFMGNISDMPTALRSGFANIYLGGAGDARILVLAAAMGRPLIMADEDLPEKINTVLKMGNAARRKLEQESAQRAAGYSLTKIVAELEKLYS
ncbi:MAG: hypothetical protein LBO08_03045 [Rickettsiales bacterium]|jgi:glycosyltransferase involved in cell wall biosynthesis|nr:hypothetical protein [Rickettsiales bacterium]